MLLWASACSTSIPSRSLIICRLLAVERAEGAGRRPGVKLNQPSIVRASIVRSAKADGPKKVRAVVGSQQQRIYRLEVHSETRAL